MSKVKINWSLLTELSKEEVESYVPATSGVFILLIKKGSGGWRCFYTGHSENIRHTLIQVSEGNSAVKEVNKIATNYFCAFIYATCQNHLQESIAAFLSQTYNTGQNHSGIKKGQSLLEVNLPKQVLNLEKSPEIVVI